MVDDCRADTNLKTGSKSIKGGVASMLPAQPRPGGNMDISQHCHICKGFEVHKRSRCNRARCKQFASIWSWNGYLYVEILQEKLTVEATPSHSPA